MPASEYQYIPGEIGLKIDERNGRVSVLLRSGDLREPAEFSPKRDSGAEDVLKEALLWQQVLGLGSLDGAWVDGRPVERKALLSVDDGTVEHRIEIDLATKTKTWKTPIAVWLSEDMDQLVPALETYTEHGPSADTFVLAHTLRDGDVIEDDGEQSLSGVTHLGKSGVISASNDQGRSWRWAERGQVVLVRRAGNNPEHWGEKTFDQLRPGDYVVHASQVRVVEDTFADGEQVLRLRLRDDVHHTVMHLSDHVSTMMRVISPELAEMAIAMGGSEQSALGARSLLQAGYRKR